MSIVIKHHDRKFLAALKKATATGLQRAGTFLQSECKLALNVANTGSTIRRKGRRAKTVYRNSSSPGEPPRIRTGWLQRHVVREFDKSGPAVRVGVAKNAVYGLMLELGTGQAARRPWLVSTFMKHRARIALLATGTPVGD